MFIDNEDYRVVIGEAALKVVSQSTPENIANAEVEAIEEIPAICARYMIPMPFSRLQEQTATGS